MLNAIRLQCEWLLAVGAAGSRACKLRVRSDGLLPRSRCLESVFVCFYPPQVYAAGV